MILSFEKSKSNTFTFYENLRLVKKSFFCQGHGEFQNAEKVCVCEIHCASLQCSRYLQPSEIRLFKCTSYTRKSTGWLHMGTHCISSGGTAHFHIVGYRDDPGHVVCFDIFPAYLGATIFRDCYLEERSQQYKFFSREIFHLYRHHQMLLFCTMYYILYNTIHYIWKCEVFKNMFRITGSQISRCWLQLDW